MPELDPDAIDALLPQTQCTQCGYTGCRPYAEAIAHGTARINQCPPGGDAGVRALAALTGLPYAPLDPAHGREKPRTIAVIDEAACIGCTICIQKCPVDAIVGAAKLMHTVIADECTGCELCVVPCPVDCIHLLPVPPTHPVRMTPLAAAALARRRHRARLARLERLALTRLGRETTRSGIAADAATAAPSADSRNDASRAESAEGVAGASTRAPRDESAIVGSVEHKQLAIRAALERARNRRRTPQ